LTHPVGVLYEIRWKEICPWLILVKALRITLLIRVLVLALVGVMLTQWGSATIDGFFSLETPSLTQITDSSVVDDLPNLPLQADLPTNGVLHLASTSPYLRGWHWVSQPFFRLADREISWQTSLILLTQGCWMMAVWAVFGGAIVRIAAISLTRGEILSPLVALRDAITVWPSTTGATIIAMLGAIALAVPLVLLGFLLRMNFMAVVAGLLWCLVLAWGLMLAVVLLGFLLGWPLMWACLGVERSDAFDGVSRCYAYVYQKPLQLTFYVLITALLAFLGEAVVYVFATASVSIAEWTLSWGTGDTRADALFGSGGNSSTAPLAVRAISSVRLFHSPAFGHFRLDFIC